MTEVLSISLDQIHVPEDYVRPLDEGAAQRLARLIEREGQKAPIAVYRSTARQGGEKPYTLIYGARRLRAMAIRGHDQIDAVLRTKAEARRLQIMDNLATTSLDELEGAEYLAAYRELWEVEFGPVRRGGDRRSKVHNETLIRDLQFLEKHNFFNHINEELGIKPSRAKRLLAISRIDERLRNAVRGTQWAKDQKYLKKLTKFTQAEQAGIAGAMKIEPDLDTVLRMDDPATGRKGVGRMETGDWREMQFIDAWKGMPSSRRAIALEKIGAVAKPLDPWPMHFPLPPARRDPGNNSPLWDAIRDPMSVAVRLTYEEIEKAKAEYEAEAKFEADWAVKMALQVNAIERENRAEYERQKAKTLAAHSRKPKRGRPADTPEVRREKLFRKLFTPDLAEQLLLIDIPAKHPTIRYLKTCNVDDQFAVACHIGNGHSYALDEVMWRVERSRTDIEG